MTPWAVDPASTRDSVDPAPTRACRSSSLTAADASGPPGKVLALAASKSVGLKPAPVGGLSCATRPRPPPSRPLHGTFRRRSSPCGTANVPGRNSKVAGFGHLPRWRSESRPDIPGRAPPPATRYPSTSRERSPLDSRLLPLLPLPPLLLAPRETILPPGHSLPDVPGLVLVAGSRSRQSHRSHYLRSRGSLLSPLRASLPTPRSRIRVYPRFISLDASPVNRQPRDSLR